MKRAVFIIIIFMALFTAPVFAEYVPELDGEPEFNGNVVSLMSGENILSPQKILSGLWEDIGREIRESMGYMLLILVTAAMTGTISILSDSLGKRAGREAAFFACFVLMSTAALKCFGVALDYGAEVIEAISAFVTKLSPLLMMLLITCGDAASAAVFHPVLSAAVFVMTMLVQKILIPLNVFGAVLSVSGNIGSINRISGFCNIVKSINKWLMSAIITVFTGISAIYGFSAPSIDALSMKMVKFAAGSLVPVVGGFLSDTVETVMSGSRLMKNAVGGAGIIALCSICIIPVIKIGVIHFMLKLSAAVSEALADKRISSMMWDMSEAVGGIFGIVVMSLVLFIINLCIILAATNFS